MSISSKSSWKAVVMVATILLIYCFAVVAALPDGDGANVGNDVGVAKQVQSHQAADSISTRERFLTQYLPPGFGRRRIPPGIPRPPYAAPPKPPFVRPPPRYFGPPPPPRFLPGPFFKPPPPRRRFCPPPVQYNSRG